MKSTSFRFDHGWIVGRGLQALDGIIHPRMDCSLRKRGFGFRYLHFEKMANLIELQILRKSTVCVLGCPHKIAQNSE